MAVVVGAVVGMAVVGEAVVGGHQRSSAGSSPVRWLLRIMPLLFRTMRRPTHRHRLMGRGGGVTPRSLITPTHRLAPAGSEPFSPGETETKTRIDNISVSFAFLGECFKFCFQSPKLGRWRNPPHCCYPCEVPFAHPVCYKGLW